ncbi:hypothetical protein RESH_05908 [Rhodopirellula europaea SH398]|jgi:hypothetical protein|uniref:Uncharacterized protein n=1 Tax=Rhodopirellula europaea SH398 TaxID=1263868 RepID=M5S7A1_9BACT|nr:hypothetical protein RESH_05908 [Rhodopirellula europaea SH398]
MNQREFVPLVDDRKSSSPRFDAFESRRFLLGVSRFAPFSNCKRYLGGPEFPLTPGVGI